MSHSLENVYRKNGYKNPIDIQFKCQIYQIANNEQDKKQRRIMKTKDKMIGISIFFSDVHQP